MAKKILNVINQGYRATLEEQDDPVVWISHALNGAGGNFHVLLQGHATNYAVKGQDASGLQFGSKKQTQPAQLAKDISKFVEKDVTVYIVEEDAAERGLEPRDLVSGLESISRTGLAKLFEQYDQVWYW